MKKLIRPQNGQISASLMCANFFELGKDIKAMENLCIEYLHIDIMDGTFVPNYTLGTDIIKQLKKETSIPVDTHLMICEPERKLNYFSFGEGDIVSFHVEATNHIQRTIAHIRETGAIPMPALNPATPLCMLDYIIEEIDAVLIMTVNPGYAGQALIEATIGKIARLREISPDLTIEVDGNVNIENAMKMRKAGADIFVAGSSGMFIRGKSLSETVPSLREAII